MRSILCMVLCVAGLLHPSAHRTRAGDPGLSLPRDARADDTTKTLIQQGRWKQVRAIAQARIKAAPEDPEANYLMGRVLMRWGDGNAAMPYAEKAVRLASGNAEYHWLLAELVSGSTPRSNRRRRTSSA